MEHAYTLMTKMAPWTKITWFQKTTYLYNITFQAFFNLRTPILHFQSEKYLNNQEKRWQENNRMFCQSTDKTQMKPAPVFFPSFLFTLYFSSVCCWQSRERSVYTVPTETVSSHSEVHECWKALGCSGFFLSLLIVSQLRKIRYPHVLVQPLLF